MTPELPVDERLLLELPDGLSIEGITADGHAYGLLQADGALRFVWDGTAGEAFDDLWGQRDGTVRVISDDGNHVAYVGLRSGGAFVGRDGGEDPAVEGVSGSVPPVLSIDGAHIAYGAQVSGTQRLIFDRTAISQSPLAPIAAVFSDDGSHFAFVEMTAPIGPKSEFRIVLDGVPGPWFFGMRNARGAMQFSPDGRRFAYYQIDGKGHARWVVDDVAQPWFGDVRPIGLKQIRGIGVLDPELPARFSPDGSRFAYAADVEGKGVSVIEDGRVGPRVKDCTWPVFSSDGRRLVYAVETLEGRGAVVIDGEIGSEWAQVPMAVAITPDGRRFAMSSVREEGRLFRKRKFYSLIVDDQLITEQIGVNCLQPPIFSPDGARVMWWVGPEEDKVQMYLDGRPVGTTGASYPAFSSSGQFVFAAWLDGGVTVMVEGRPGPMARELLGPIGDLARAMRDAPTPFRLSHDGNHVAWAGLFDPDGANASARPVLDDRIGPAFDRVLDWSFEPDGTATWCAQRGRSLIRVSAAT